MTSLKRKSLLISLAALALCLLVSGAAAAVPAVQERLAWRLDALQSRIKYALSPPEQVVFVPEGSLSTPILPAGLPPTPAPTFTPPPSTPLPPAAAPLPSPTPLPTSTPLPGQARLVSVRHEYQTWNNCGPATLSMALTFWGWQGDQRPIAAAVKPNPRDKNVMPQEMVDYVTAQTGLQALARIGGDLPMLKSFLAQGFPVIVEKGIEDSDGWLGHYVLLTGYDDAAQSVIYHDSLKGPDRSIAYDVLMGQWRAFNYTYLVVFPAAEAEQVQRLLGEHAAQAYNDQSAAETASAEISALQGRDLYFAWFNRGSSLVRLQDYASAAAAYDQAFAIYPQIPARERPWRMLWYQTGPYWAYYYSGRYEDVVNLATTTLDAMSEPVLEESYYWRALAREALGDSEGAVKDLRASLAHHPGFGPSAAKLASLGEPE